MNSSLPWNTSKAVTLGQTCPSGLLSASEPRVLMNPLYQKSRGFTQWKNTFPPQSCFSVINNQNLTYLEVNKTSIDPLLPWLLNTRIILPLAGKNSPLLGVLVTTDCSLILKHRVKQAAVLQEWGTSYYRKTFKKISKDCSSCKL